MSAEATVAPSAGSRKEPRALKLKLPRRKPTTEVLQARGIELLKSFHLLCVILETRHERERPRNQHQQQQLQQIHSLTRCSDSLTTMRSSLPSLAVGDVIAPTNCPQLLTVCKGIGRPTAGLKRCNHSFGEFIKPSCSCS